MSSGGWRWIDDSGLPAGGALGPGARFGSFELLDLLGEGGMGRVFRARDAAGREVALKLTKTRLDPRRLARFQREGELVARLRDPGILRVLGGGQLGGLPFLVYELVAGARELDQAFRGAPLRERVRLVAGAARALGAAHAAGVVHRDLKPANVLVDAEGRPRVADFGLAVAGEVEPLTQTGALLGTPGYMSPEQLVGDLARVGPPSDVWALGVILYEALCGARPFRAESWTELQAQALRAEPTPPHRLDAGVAPALSAVCVRALAKAPEERYPDGAALADELESWLEGGETGAGRAARRSRRRRAVGAAVGLGAAAVALAVGSLLLTGSLPPPAGGPGPSPAQARLAPTGSGAAAESPPAEPVETAASNGRAAAEAWREIVTGEDARRLPAAYAWLVAHPDHPAAPEARALLRSRQREGPLLLVEHPSGGNVRVAFASGDALFTHGGGGLARWRLASGEVSGRWHERAFVHELVRLRDGGLVFDTGEELRRTPPDPGAAPRWRRGLAGKPRGLCRTGDLLAVSLDRQPWIQLVRLEDGRPAGRLQLGEGLEGKALRGHPTRPVLFGVLQPQGGYRDALASLGRSGGPSDPGAGSGAPDARAVGAVYAWDPVRRVRIGRRRLGAAAVPLALAPSGDVLVAGTTAGVLKALDPETLEERFRLEDAGLGARAVGGAAHRGYLVELAFSPGGRRLASASGGAIGGTAELKVWDLAERRLVRAERLPTGPRGLAFSPDGRLLAVGLDDGTAQVWLLELPR